MKNMLACGQDMLAVWQDRLNGCICRNCNVIGGFLTVAMPFALNLAVKTVVFTRSVGERSANLRSDNIGIIFSNLDAAHFAEKPFTKRAL